MKRYTTSNKNTLCFSSPSVGGNYCHHSGACTVNPWLPERSTENENINFPRTVKTRWWADVHRSGRLVLYGRQHRRAPVSSHQPKMCYGEVFSNMHSTTTKPNTHTVHHNLCSYYQGLREFVCRQRSACNAQVCLYTGHSQFWMRTVKMGKFNLSKKKIWNWSKRLVMWTSVWYRMT